MSTMEDRMSRVERILEEIAEMNREFRAGSLELQEGHRQLQEGDRRLQEGDRQLQEGDRSLQEGHRRMQEAIQDGHRRLQAQNEAFREEMRQAQRKWGELANKMGTLVEDVVAPGIPTVFQTVFGWDRLDATYQRMRRTHAADRGRQREFDYVVAARDLVLVTQTKSTLRPEDIPELLAVLREARDYLPEYRDRQFVGALASFSVDPSLVTAVERQGLLMFGLGTGLLEILNTRGFQPARF